MKKYLLANLVIFTCFNITANPTIQELKTNQESQNAKSSKLTNYTKSFMCALASGTYITCSSIIIYKFYQAWQLDWFKKSQISKEYRFRYAFLACTLAYTGYELAKASVNYLKE